MAKETLDGRVLDGLFSVIEDRRHADPDESRTARLFKQGPAKISKKVGEEAVEVVVAALAQTPGDLVRESADLLYHLLVLWAASGVEPEDVWTELHRRRGPAVGSDEKKPKKPKKPKKMIT